MNGPCASFFKNSLSITRHTRRMLLRRYLSYRFNTPIIPDGSVIGYKGKISQLNSPTGQSNSTVWAPSSCPSIGRDRLFKPIVAANTRSRFLQKFAINLRILAAKRASLFSWLCWRRFKSFFIAAPAKSMSPWVRRSPAARIMKPKDWSGFLLTHWCLGQILQAIRLLKSSWPVCAVLPWMHTATKTCRSKGWSKSSIRSAILVVTRCSRSYSLFGIPPNRS